MHSNLVLIVEHDEMVGARLARGLSSPEYCVVVSGDAADAVVAAADLQPDVVVVDAALPRSGAWAAIRRMAHDWRTAHVPVILLGDDPEHCVRARAAGCAELVRKPVDEAALADAVARVLDVRGATGLRVRVQSGIVAQGSPAGGRDDARRSSAR